MTIDHHPIQLLELFTLDNDNRLAFAPVQLITHQRVMISSHRHHVVPWELHLENNKKKSENWT